MKPPELNILFKVFDIILSPFMWLLSGFKFPLQETHIWHVKKWRWSTNGLPIKGTDDKALFGHNVPGLFHMPIFGGLTKYVVIEASGFKKFWNIGWEDHVQILRIKEKRVIFLVGKGGYKAYGLGDNGKQLKLKVVGYGELGDNKYKGIRLF